MADRKRIDAMHQDLFPNVDTRFAVERQGNPLEQAFAVGKGELTDSELSDMLYNAGVNHDFDLLGDDSKIKVRDGMAGIWMIDRIGISIEERDKNIVGKDKVMKSIVDEDLEQVRKGHRGPINNWLIESTSNLVKAAGEKDEDAGKRFKDGVMVSTDEYIRKLRYIGIDFKERTQFISEPGQKETIEGYLNNDRDVDLRKMQEILFEKLGSVVTDISPKAIQSI